MKVSTTSVVLIAVGAMIGFSVAYGVYGLHALHAHMGEVKKDIEQRKTPAFSTAPLSLVYGQETSFYKPLKEPPFVTVPSIPLVFHRM